MAPRIPSHPALPAGAEQHFQMLEQKYNLPEGYLRGMSWVESQYGSQHDRPGSQYKGMFQMGQHERQQYGVKNPADWRQSAEGAARLGAANKTQLESSLGRPVTGQELYIAHQQGQGGARSLLSHPNAPAGSAVNPKFIRSNHGNPNAPASQFTQKFAERYNQAPGGNGEQAATQYAKNDAPMPPSRPGDLNQQPQQIARNDFGRGIPQNGMTTPGVGQRLDPVAQQSQMPQIARNDFGRGIPSNGMQTPGVGQRLEPMPQTQMARNDIPPGSVLNRINPRDPSGPLLPEGNQSQQFARNEPQVSAKQYFEQRYAPTQTAQETRSIQPGPQTNQARLDNQWASRPQYDYGKGGSQQSSPSSQMSDDQVLAMLDSMKGKAPQASQQLFGALDNAKNSRGALSMTADPKAMALGPSQNNGATPQLADNRANSAPLLGDNNTGGGATPASQSAAPTPPARPMSFGGSPVQVANVHQQQPQGIDAMLSEPQGGGGGVEGMAGGQQMAQMSPEMLSPQAMAGGGFDGFGDLGGLFADAFMPDTQPQFADAGVDMGGGIDFGGFDLGSLFG